MTWLREDWRDARSIFFYSHFSPIRRTINNSRFLFSRMKPYRRTFGVGSFSHIRRRMDSMRRPRVARSRSLRKRDKLPPSQWKSRDTHRSRARPSERANEVLRFTFRPRELIYVATNNINQLRASWLSRMRRERTTSRRQFATFNVISQLSKAIQIIRLILETLMSTDIGNFVAV